MERFAEEVIPLVRSESKGGRRLMHGPSFFEADPPIHELLARRWSPRAIDPDRPVPRGCLRTLLEAARVAPSCFNEQPWRFLVFDEEDPEALEVGARLSRPRATPGRETRPS